MYSTAPADWAKYIFVHVIFKCKFKSTDITRIIFVSFLFVIVTVQIKKVKVKIDTFQKYLYILLPRVLYNYSSPLQSKYLSMKKMEVLLKKTGNLNYLQL